MLAEQVEPDSLLKSNNYVLFALLFKKHAPVCRALMELLNYFSFAIPHEVS